MITIKNMDVMAGLAELADDSVDCIITSPPYWGLRDYGVDGQIGQEETLAAHIETIVAVGEELRRVLKPAGTFWLNYGDCYAYGRIADGCGLKPKDLMMLPARIAIALQEAGWWLRAENIWGKPNPMPESTRDRPAVAHEKIYMLTKSARYFYDRDAVRVDRSGDEDANGFRGGSYVGGKPGKRTARGNARPTGWGSNEGGHGRFHQEGREKNDKQRGHSRRHVGFSERWDGMNKAEQQAGGRNLRNYERAPVTVWEMAAHPFKEAHFATFPPELVERCIKAGCPAGGLVLDPFGGAGTTALVADRMQRDAILIEINPDYCRLARERIEADQGGLLKEPVREVQADWIGGAA